MIFIKKNITNSIGIIFGTENILLFQGEGSIENYDNIYN